MNEASDHDGLPSKVLTILSSGKPILAATSPETPLAQLITECGNGIRVNRGEAKSIANEIRAIYLGKRENLSNEFGREFVVRKYSKEAITNQYVSLVSSII